MVNPHARHGVTDVLPHELSSVHSKDLSALPFRLIGFHSLHLILCINHVRPSSFPHRSWSLTFVSLAQTIAPQTSTMT